MQSRRKSNCRGFRFFTFQSRLPCMQTRRSINKSVFIVFAMIKKVCVKSYSSFLIVKKLIQVFFLGVDANISTVKAASIHSSFRTCGRISFLFPGDTIWVWFSSFKKWLTHSWRRPISYRNQSTDLLRNSMDWFLYDIGLRHEMIK